MTIVGCGRIAGGFNEHDERRVLTHVAAYRNLHAAVVGCCDVDGQKARAFADRWSVPEHGTNLEAMLDSTQPDVVSICIPPAGRVPVLERVLATPSVRAVLLEKPIGGSRDETDAIARLVDRSRRPVLVNYCRAFDPFYRQLRRDCAQAPFGPLREIVARYYGTARTNASHLIERVIDMAGAAARAQRLSGSDDAPVFQLSFESTGVTALFLSTARCEYAPSELDLLFERGRIRVIDSERRVERFVSRADEHFDGFFNLVPVAGDAAAPSHDGIQYAVEEVLRAARGEAVADDIFERSVAVDRVLDEIGAR